MVPALTVSEPPLSVKPGLATVTPPVKFADEEIVCPLINPEVTTPAEVTVKFAVPGVPTANKALIAELLLTPIPMFPVEVILILSVNIDPPPEPKINAPALSP